MGRLRPGRIARGLGLLIGAGVIATHVSAAPGYPVATGARAKPSGVLETQSSATASSRARSRRATKLRATTGCTSTRKPYVTFRWIPARNRGRAQRVDYTEFFAGFSSGTFHKSRKLAPGKRRWRTTNIKTGFDYSWRVMTRRGDRWVRSRIRGFDGPVCIG
jgi:hypothetical protein